MCYFCWCDRNKIDSTNTKIIQNVSKCFNAQKKQDFFLKRRTIILLGIGSVTASVYKFVSTVRSVPRVWSRVFRPKLHYPANNSITIHFTLIAALSFFSITAMTFVGFWILFSWIFIFQIHKATWIDPVGFSKCVHESRWNKTFL